MAKFISILSITFMVYTTAYAQKAEVIQFSQLEQLMNKGGDQVRVINFWATWCGPCIKELPYFESVAKNNENVEVNLISLDFIESLDKVNAFIEKKNLQSTVLLLDDIDYNSWIDRVDKSWSGAIPATLLINSKTGKRKFVEKELSEGELEELITELSN